MKKGTVYVALSGGVDSSVAALLLLKQGYSVVGVFMKPWSPYAAASSQHRAAQCLWEQDREDALRVASHLQIPLLTWDFSAAYARAVARPMIAGYRQGITPNPDVECNRHIKFGIFYDAARRAGADFIATGHYARIRAGNLERPKDRNKDQTYFLWGMPKKVLVRTLFPLHNLTKPEVRKLAQQHGLPVAAKKDSQGVCFVGEISMRDFLRSRIPDRPGNIVHVDGRVLGTHPNAALYTIGQRHGLDVRDGGGPYYVVKKDIKRRLVVVDDNVETLAAHAARIQDCNWLERPRLGDQIFVQARYRSTPVPARWTRGGVVRFDQPIQAVAPGQSAVVYRKNRVLGGGIIVEGASLPSGTRTAMLGARIY